MLKRASAILAACGLVAAPVVMLASAQAAVPSATVSVACADSVSSLTVYVDEVVSFGGVPAGCTVVSNSATGNLDRVSASGFVAFAVGSGAVFQLMTDGTTQYLVKVDVTIVERPAPSPTPTPTPENSSVTSPTTSTTTASATATASPSPTPVSLETADATPPQPSQQLRPRDVSVGPALEPGTVAFFNDKGHPLQLLSVSGDREDVRVLNRGMDYSALPANWQRLGYGDLCWTYAGYRGVKGLVLPVATPPFATVPADWVLTAAIATTSSGNRILLDPVPGQVVTADGRDVNAVTLCADGYAPTAPEAAASRQYRNDHNSGNANSGNGAGNIGGNVGTGQCRGNGNFKHGCEPSYPGVTGGGVVIPAITKEPGTTSTQVETPTPSETPTASSSTEDDPLVPVCRATDDPRNPYRFETVRTSQIEDGQGNRLFPTEGWTDVIPPVPGITAGQNWPEGAGMLSAATRCQVTQPVREPVPSASPTPTITVTALPQPTFSESAPVMTASAVPQPTFTAYTSIVPWPPLYPIPVPTPLLVPTPTPTPAPSTASPVASPPLPSASATATPVASPPPATPSPFPIPASPTPYPTPTPTASLATPTPMPKVPTLIPPLQEPSVPLTPVIALREPGTVVASPTASPTAKPRPTATTTSVPTATPTAQATASPTATPSISTSTASGTATPTPIPSPPTTLASPLATPPPPTTAASGTAVPTATPSPKATLASPTATPPLPTPSPTATGDRPGTDGTRTVTVLLTNGPDTVTYTTTIDALQAVIDETDTGVTGSTGGEPDGTTDGKPGAGTGTGPTELANTGSTEAWLIVGGMVVAGGALLLLPAARGRRVRLGVVAGLTITGLVTSTTVAWSVASAERAFGIAQAQSAMEWGSSSEAIARLTFVRPGGQSPIGPDPVYVFDGIDEGTLTRGPGWYPTTAAPGAPGTTAIAGHRTGYGAPFADLDELRSGDTIVMQTPEGDRRTYRVAEVRLVDTDEVWVLGPDPLGTGASTLTLTTCDPPGVNTQRLVVLAALVSGSSPA